MTVVNNDNWEWERLLDERKTLFSAQMDRSPYDLAEAFDFAYDNAQRTCVAQTLREAKESGRTCVVPRSGVASWEGQRDLMTKLDLAGAGFLSITVDSMTRDLRFGEATELLAASTRESSRLNGYPLVAHGIDQNRALVRAFSKPVIVRANAVDLRVVAETAFASGATGFVSGPMYATLEYSKRASLSEAIPNWQYIFRLMGGYAEHGITIAEDAIGFSQSGSCSVPSVMHVGVVLDALIMAAQGVKAIMVYQMFQGNLAQDVAGCLAVDELVTDYLHRFGFDDVETFVAGSDWNGPFPIERPAAYGLIASNVLAAAIARTPVNYVKSIDEGRGVPSAESNARSIEITRYIIDLIGPQGDQFVNEAVEAERYLNVLEARSILDSILDTGDGDPVVGSIKACESGLLDIPFSPNVHVRGDVLPIRDGRGAVRFLDPGGLCIPEEALRLEQEHLTSRITCEGGRIDYAAVINDIGFFEMSKSGADTDA